MHLSRRRDRVRAWIVGLAGRFANPESFESGSRVNLSSLREGDVGIVPSVLYSPRRTPVVATHAGCRFGG